MCCVIQGPIRKTGTMAGILDKGIGYPGDKRLKKMEMLI